VRLLDFVEVVEILVLVAIGIEVFALYKHSQLENRMEEHIQNTCDHLIRSDELIKMTDEHMSKLDEHMIRLDEHMNTMSGYITTVNEHLIRYDEHVNRLDDLIWKSYVQKSEKKDTSS
jgi:hypothetical protein